MRDGESFRPRYALTQLNVPISTAAELPMPTFIGTALNSSRLKP